MSVLSVLFDKSVNQFSPVVDDFVRVSKKDTKGDEVVTYEKFDSAEYQKSISPVDNWGLNSLIAAGIDPAFGIHTSGVSRLDGVAQVESAVQYADTLLAEDMALLNNEPKNDE